jgi:hypothetical protein
VWVSQAIVYVSGKNKSLKMIRRIPNLDFGFGVSNKLSDT